MALLITFRVNRAYERLWEARRLWGMLVNISRNLAIKVRKRQRPERSDCQTVASLIVAFCVGSKDHLRDDAE
jgi:putative membrane protein